MGFLAFIGFVGFIVFIVMTVISLIKKNNKTKRNLILMATSFLLFMVGVVNLDTEGTTKDKNSQEASTDVKDEKKEDEKKANDKPKKDTKKTDDNRTIAEKLQEDDKNVDKANLKDGVLTLEAVGKTTFSENTLFHSVYDLFEAMHQGFQDNGVKSVEVILTTTMIDPKGNESDEPVINYEYSRESFKELNYDKFSDMAYGQQWRILNEADSYFIHPGIYKNLKDEYTNNLSHGKSKVRQY